VKKNIAVDLVISCKGQSILFTMTSSDNKAKPVNLFDYSEEELLQNNALTHYEILNVPVFATTDDVKKAYRKSSLKYHPDKTGRGDDDYVFLAVKAAYDTLTDSAKRQAYDSTVMPFDDEIPPSRSQLLQDPLLLYKDEDFYDLFGPVFERNLRFDARLRPENHKKNKNNNNIQKTSASKAPTLGDANTPIEEVHAFYEYWVHFESWRDYSQTAADELEIDQENAESRYEKRWLQKEIDRRAKQLKKQEMARIQLLVERASEADPRLRKERLERQQAKVEAAKQRELEAERKKQEQIEAEKREEERLEQEKQQKAAEKMAREQEKKMIRKERQQLRRMTSASFESVKEEEDELPWKDSYDMSVDVDFLCASLSFTQLKEINTKYESHEDHAKALQFVQEKVKKVKDGEECGNADQSPEPSCGLAATELNNSGTRSSATSNPWSQEEMSALAKGIKKFPAGGANRWDQIANYVNNLCRQDVPRTRQECIDKYNALARESKHTDTTTEEEPKNGAENGDESNEWTAEQDQQLQDGLTKFPATMDKNERWASIAKGVTGKSKKDCVQRFKAIREALKNRK
jgi:DnaJ family protein C protein 2